MTNPKPRDAAKTIAARTTLVLCIAFLSAGCLDFFDEGGETSGEPRRGEDIDADGTGGLPLQGSGGAIDSGSGGVVASGGGGAVGSSGGGGTGGGAAGVGGLTDGGGGSDGGATGGSDAGAGDGGSGAAPASGGANAGFENWEQAILERHNEVRALHCVPEVTWNEEAAAFAQSWAEGLCPTMTLMHSMGSGFGENLYMSWGTGSETDLEQSAVGAVTGWYDEIEDYNYANPGFAQGTGHFTQVVWEGSTAVGCGIATCNVSQWTVVVVSCNYSPPGNYTNQFEENVPPLCQ